MVAVRNLEVTHHVDGVVHEIDNNVKGIEGQVEGVAAVARSVDSGTQHFLSVTMRKPTPYSHCFQT